MSTQWCVPPKQSDKAWRKVITMVTGAPPAGNRRILIRNAGPARQEELARERADLLLQYHKARRSGRSRRS